ncbi:MAG TPA: dihydrolipoamide acetyltransferase family protein [Solirubrobacterales bacterium]|jgi:pyruvate dehydrogenase E2 component (dihydrolipoamide acetyltransferase)
MTDVVMPRLSDSMEEGTIIAWLKQVGDEIAVGDELVEIETDKANMAYEADVAGMLTEILAEEGQTLAIGSPIARVGDASEVVRGNGEGQAAPAAGPVGAASPTVLGGEAASAPRGTPAPPPPAEGAGESRAEGSGRVKASPVAKRLARDRGLELSQVHGSGPGGRIVKADVEAAEVPAVAAGDGAAAAPPAPGAEAAAVSPSTPETAKGQVTVEEPSKLQQTVARRMAESKATAPHFYLRAEVEMSKAVSARAALKASAKEGEVVPSFNDMVVKAAAIALREFPKANAAYRDGRFELYSRVGVGVAVAARGALVVPTVFDADKKGLRQIAAETRAAAAKVREGTITPPELSGATFTVSNLGMYGIDDFDAVINTPQAAILAVGAIAERPVVRGGEIVPAQTMRVSLACDHRILYGAEGAEFLARIRALLEEPLALAL